jgi:hypothetical protein
MRPYFSILRQTERKSCSATHQQPLQFLGFAARTIAAGIGLLRQLSADEARAGANIEQTGMTQ